MSLSEYRKDIPITLAIASAEDDNQDEVDVWRLSVYPRHTTDLNRYWLLSEWDIKL